MSLHFFVILALFYYIYLWNQASVKLYLAAQIDFLFTCFSSTSWRSSYWTVLFVIKGDTYKHNLLVPHPIQTHYLQIERDKYGATCDCMLKTQDKLKMNKIISTFLNSMNDCDWTDFKFQYLFDHFIYTIKLIYIH